MSKVYYINIKDGEKDSSVVKKLNHLLEESDCFDFIKKDDLVSVKVTFGEEGNKFFITPSYIKPVTDKLARLKAKPFLTDANVLYKGKRNNAVDHLNLARKHGFAKCNIPIIISDGLLSKNYRKVSIDKKHFKTVNISSDALDVDCVIAISHFTGHMQTGFGGAIKNLGMGFASRSGKQQQHSHVKPEVEKEKCTFCKACFDICPVSAIVEKDKRAFIKSEVCLGCAECVATCKFFAIKITWEESDEILQEKIAEYASGVLKNKIGRIAFVTFALKIPKECDCWSGANHLISKDIGIFISKDPVAVDKAAVDKIVELNGEDVFTKAQPKTDWHRQIEYGASIGLGNLDYEIVDITDKA